MVEKLISTNPSKNYEVIGKVEVSSEKEIRDAVGKANRAKEKWASLGIKERVKMLSKVYENFSKRKQELALLETKEMGMPISQSLGSVDFGLSYFKWYLENAEKCLAPEITYEDNKSVHEVFYEPIGTAAVITPWNFPFSNMILGVMPNLVVGNTVVFKHSEECPLSGKLIEEIMNHSGLPDGVFNEVYGNGKTGDYLVHQDINMICFTGSSKVGKYLYELASKKFIKAFFELGGSDPGIVFEDADIDKVLDSIYSGRFYNCGQVCCALKRLIVHESKFEEVIKKLKAHVEAKKVGNPEDKSTDLGPLVSEKQLILLKDQVKDAVNKGAKIVTGGKSPDNLKGAYYLPTLLVNVTPDMRIWKEEVFGPVLPIVSFKTEDEAVKLANDTVYGLGSYIFMKDSKKAARVAEKIKSGVVNINNVDSGIPCNPFGGYKCSGLGRGSGKHGLRELCQIKAVSMEK